MLVGTGGASYDESVMRTLTSLTQTAVADPSSSSVRARLEWLMHDPSTVTDELVYLRQSIYQRPDFGATVSQVLCLQQPDIRRANLLSPQDWSAIKHPCLVLWGSSDRSAPPSKGREIARMTPKGEFVELEQAGHWPQFERPASFNQAVFLWLESLNHEQRN